MYGAEIEISEMAHDQKASPFNPTDRPGIKVEETEAYAPIGCDTQRGFMKWSRTSYDSKKEHSRTRENEKGIQNPQV